MKVTFALLGLLLTLGPAHAADEAFELQAVGMLEVAPDGSVHDYTLETKLDPQVAALVDSTVRGWQFEPVLVDGRAVIAVTRMRLDLEALPRDDGYALQVANVGLGEPEAKDNQPPRYPASALREGVGAKVSLLLALNANGTVDKVHVEQVSLTEPMGKRGDLLRERFADVSRETAMGWTYDMAEIVDGEPVTAQIRVPVEFGLRNAEGWTARAEYIPGEVVPAPWGSRTAPDDRSLAQGDVQSLDGRVKLRDDVVGSLL